MRGRSYSYSPSPPRGYGRRGRSPSPKGRYGGGRSRDLPTSLLVRNLRHDCREPRGFGFIQFVDPSDAADAKYNMDGEVLLGRELTVVFAEENRKKPSEMRARDRVRLRGRDSIDRRRSRSPRYRHSRRYSRSPAYYSPAPRSRRYSRYLLFLILELPYQDYPFDCCT
ncbi:Serine/arginine-rich SC35-like splicing factor SCL30A [Linum perenne]